MTAKYIGLDVHQATISAAVLDSNGKVDHGVHPGDESGNRSAVFGKDWRKWSLCVTFEEGTCAAWLHDLLKPHVTKRFWSVIHEKNSLLKAGNKNDRIDARKLAEKLLRTGLLSPVYHGESGVRTLRELSRSYLSGQPGSHAGDEPPEGPV